MTWHVAVYEALLHSALVGFVWLAAASTAVLLIREPARKIRVIELALVGLFLLPLLALLPGYPRLAVLPVFTRSPVTAEEHFEGDILATGMMSDASPPADEAPAVLGALPPENASSTAEISPPALAESDAVEPIGEPDFAPAPSEIDDSGEPATAAIALAPFPAPRRLRESTAMQIENWDIRIWLVGAYLAGVAGMMLWSLVGLAAVWRLMRSARPAGDACRAMLREIAGPASERVRLLVSPRASQPCAVAWRPTAIVLPERLVAAADAQKLRWVLAHEWSHVERADVWAWSLSGLARWLYFYQPMLWWLRRQLQLCQDFVADARAARLAAAPEDYAEFLTSVCSQYSRPTLAAGLGIGGGGSELERRVVMLVDPHRPLEVASPRRWNLVVVPIAMLFVAALAALSQRPNGVAAEPQGEKVVEAAAAPTIAEASKPTAGTEPAVAGEHRAAIATLVPRRLLGVIIEAALNEDPFVVEATKQATMLKEQLADLRTRSADSQASALTPELLRRILQLEARIEDRKNQLRPSVVEALTAQSTDSKRPTTQATERVDATVDQTLPAPPANPALTNKIMPGDLLSIEIIVAPEEKPLSKLLAGMVTVDSKPYHGQKVFLVQPDGDLSLGPICGRVAVAGLTEVEAEAAIIKQLAKTFTVEEPKVQIGNRRHVFLVNFVEGPAKPFRLQPGDEVQIEAVDSASPQRILRMEAVGEQGVRLGAAYGRVNLLGLTLREAEAAVQAHLKEHFHGPPHVAVVIARPEKNAVRAAAPARATGLPGIYPATQPGAYPATTGAPAIVPSNPYSSGPVVRPVPDSSPTNSKGPTGGFVATETKDTVLGTVLQKFTAVTRDATPDKLEPLDTVEILLALKPKVHKDLATGQSGDVFTGNMPEFSGTYVIEPDGDISLPHGYGRVNVKGLDVKQAGAAIRTRLSEKLFTRTALPAVTVVKRGRAVFPEGREPAAGYRIRKGDRLLIGQTPQMPWESEVGSEGELAWSLNAPEKTQNLVEGLTLAEAQEALQKVAVRDVLAGAGGGPADLTKTAKRPVPIFLTIGGWREEADPEVIARLEGDDKTHVERLEREIHELKDLIRGLKDSKP